MEEISCHICGEKKNELLYPSIDYLTGVEFCIVRCRACAFVYVNPRPSAGEMDRFYPSSYYGDRRSIFEKMTCWLRSRRVKRAYDAKAPGSILDVGCGKGGMLRVLKRQGWRVLGTEFGAKPREPLEDSTPIEIVYHNLEECDFSDVRFDVVTLWHVLEHLPDPRETLGVVRNLLKPDGILILSVPNMESLQSKLTRKNWFHLDPPRHLYDFSMNDINRLLGQVGFVIEKRRRFSFEYDTFGLTQSLLNLLVSRQNLLFELLTHRGSFRGMGDLEQMETDKKGKKRFLIDWSGVMVSLFLAPPFFFISLFFCPLESLLGYGGTIEVVARKVKK